MSNEIDKFYKIVLKKESTPLDDSFFLFTIDMYRYSNYLKRQEIDEETFNEIRDAVDKELEAFLQREAKKHQASL